MSKVIASETIGVEHIQQKKVCVLFTLCFSPAVWLDAVLLLAEQFCHLIHVQSVAVGVPWLPFLLRH